MAVDRTKSVLAILYTTRQVLITYNIMWFNECILVDQANSCNRQSRTCTRILTYMYVYTYTTIGVLGNASRSYVVALQKCQKKKRGSFLFKVKMISV